jgi:hypothetical protein
MRPGALLEFCTKEDWDEAGGDERRAARLGFRRRLRETPGIVSSAHTGTAVDAGLEIRAIKYDLSPKTSEYFQMLREEGVTPDGYELAEAVDVWRHAKELALGFHQVWDPRPPEEWRNARREWFQFVRAVISRSRTWDSPSHVEQACESGELPDGKLHTWRAIEKTFVPNPVPLWHDDSAIKVAAKWMHEPGIVWTEHVEFAKRLSEKTGAKYYGAKGLTESGEFVDDGDSTHAIILSVDANREGRNLQAKWSRNLVVSPMEGPDTWHQLIGRTHRPGQSAERVTVDVFLGCAEHVRAWSKARAGARYIKDTTGAEQKLLVADLKVPSNLEMSTWSGPRWGK